MFHNFSTFKAAIKQHGNFIKREDKIVSCQQHFSAFYADSTFSREGHEGEFIGPLFFNLPYLEQDLHPF